MRTVLRSCGRSDRSSTALQCVRADRGALAPLRACPGARVPLRHQWGLAYQPRLCTVQVMTE